jgi:tetratricopeptide (TPR) repeat protein
MGGRRHILLACLAILAWPAIRLPAQAVSTPASTPASMPTSAPTGGDEVAALIAAIRQAPDAPAAAAPYNRLTQMEKLTVEAHVAYLRRMLQFGLPLAAARPASALVTADPTNGMAWGVMGYVSGKRASYPEALAQCLKAAACAPDDPSIQNNVGQLIAWCTCAKTPPKLDDAAKRAIARTEDALTGKKPYDQAAARVKAILDKHALALAAIQKYIDAAKADIVNLDKTSADLETQLKTQTQKIIDQQVVIEKLKANYQSVQNSIVRIVSVLPTADISVYQQRSADIQGRIDKETGNLNDLLRKADALRAEGLANLQKIHDKNAAIADFTKQLSAEPKFAPAFRWDPPAVDGVVTDEAVVTAGGRGPSAASAATAPAVSSADAEAVAAGKLQLATAYLGNDLRDVAIPILKEIIAQYPATKAAAEAKKLLDSPPPPPPAPK